MASREFHALDVLDDVSAGAGQYRVQHRLVGGKRRQHQAPQIRQPRQQLSAQFDAVAVWQSHVEDRDVGLKRRNPRQRLCHRSGLADDLEFGVRAEEVDESPSDDLVVIDEEDFHHSKALRRRRRDGRMYCSQYVLRFADQHRTIGVVERRVARRADERGDSVGPLVSHDQQLDRACVLGEVVQGAAVDGHRTHVEVGIALPPLGEASVKLGRPQPVTVGHGVAVVNVGEA